MQTLLSLPCEIRDQIIEFVTFSCKEAPQDPAHDVQPREDSVAQGALRLPTIRTYSATGLLGTNVQLRAETQKSLRRRKLTYTLDIMAVDDELWPTWTCCPAPATGPVYMVKISLRFLSKPDDPYMVHVARTFRAILQGRKRTTPCLHPLAALFLHVRDVCFPPGKKDMNVIENLCFDASTSNRLDHVGAMAPLQPLPRLELKSLFGQYRSLWNSFRSIHQYPFSGTGETVRLDIMASLKIMVILYMQDSWEDECAAYASYVGPLGIAFRSVRNVQFSADEQDLGQLTCSVL